MVNPPHIPTFKNNTILGFSEFVFIANATITPMIEEPMIFMVNVFIGNTHPSFMGIIPMRYLQTAPIKPPAPIIIQFYPAPSKCSHNVFMITSFRLVLLTVFFKTINIGLKISHTWNFTIYSSCLIMTPC